MDVRDETDARGFDDGGGLRVRGFGTLRQLTLDRWQAYWEVRRKDLERTVTAELVRDYKKLETLTEQRLKAGIAPAVDNLRARGATLGLETNLIQLRHQGESARAKL